MSNFISLVKVQFLSYFGLNKMLHSGKKNATLGALATAFLLLFMGALLAFMGYIYADMFALSLIMTGEIIKLVPLMVGISSLVGFMFSFYASSNVIYGFKDYEMLSAMPVKTRTIVLAKVVFSYLSDLLFTLLIVIPSLFVYNKYGGVIDLNYIASSIVVCLIAPLFPFALSTVVGALIAFISSRFKRKNLAQVILLMLVMVLIFASSFLEESGTMHTVMEKTYFIFPLCLNAFKSLVGLLIFCALCICLAVLVTVLTCVTYRKMHTLLSARKKAKGFKLKDGKINTSTRALFYKELKRFGSAPTYVANTIIGAIMTVLFGIIVLVVPGMDVISELFARLAPAIFAFTLMLAPTTVCSLSIEGETFWIIKTMPVSLKKLINVKLSINVIFGVLPALIGSTLMVLGFNGVSLICSILVVLCAVSFAFLGGNLGMTFNILFPMMKWDNINKPVKQGASLLMTMLVAMVLAALFGVGAIYLELSTFWFLFIIFAFTLILNVTLYVILMKKGEKLIIQKT